MNTLRDRSANLVIHSRFNDMSRVRLFYSFFFFSTFAIGAFGWQLPQNYGFLLINWKSLNTCIGGIYCGGL